MRIYKDEQVEGAVKLLKTVRDELPGLPDKNRMRLNVVLKTLEYGADDGIFCQSCGCVNAITR
jgi:hypothetical protein